jgi:LAO/AO transport system kinase
VGQDEIDIVRLADITLVILVPGMGDDVQSIKAGIMEIADIFVINKADREGSERVEREIRAMQSLAPRNDHWTPPIIKTVASDGTGIPELAAAIGEYEGFLQSTDTGIKKRIQSWEQRLLEMLRDRVIQKVLAEHVAPNQIADYAKAIAGHQRDPYSLVDEIVGVLDVSKGA